MRTDPQIIEKPNNHYRFNTKFCGLTPERQWKSSRQCKKIPLISMGFLLPMLHGIRTNVVAMNKSELIEAIQAALGKDATKRSADEALEAVLSSIAKGVKKDKKVQIIGFGTFEVKKRAARQGRNPKTGEAMKIAASKSVGFKPSSVLKGSL
jgi:DNA-binding protein HU-beta